MFLYAVAGVMAEWWFVCLARDKQFDRGWAPAGVLFFFVFYIPRLKLSVWPYLDLRVTMTGRLLLVVSNSSPRGMQCDFMDACRHWVDNDIPTTARVTISQLSIS